MENSTQVLEITEAPRAERESGSRLIVSLIALVALLGACLVIAHDVGTPAVEDRTKIVQAVDTPSVAEAGAAATLTAQFIDVAALIRAIVCPILAALAAAFGGFIGPIIQSLQAAFGCISPA